MRRFISSLFSLLIVSLVSCTDQLSVGKAEQKVNASDLLKYDDPSYVSGLAVMRERAELLSSVLWCAQGDIPNEMAYYYKGKTYRAVPYSSAKELDKFVGTDVSFYTFLSAIYNPDSVIYTEHIDKYPYHGINCSTYYGTTCSMSACYALGIQTQIPSKMFADSELFVKLEDQSVDKLAPGDVMASTGHTILVLDVVKNESGQLKEVEVLNVCTIRNENRDFLINLLNEGYSFYRYKYIEDNQEVEKLPFDYLSATSSYDYFHSFALSLSRGDRSSYRLGEHVHFNILQEGFGSVEVYEEDKYLESINLQGRCLDYEPKRAGMFSARLVSDNRVSEYVSFEVIDTSSNIRDEGDRVCVLFRSSNAVPHSIVVCEVSGKQHLVHFLDDSEIRKGYAFLPQVVAKEDLFIKVLFKGQFGRVASKPVMII